MRSQEYSAKHIEFCSNEIRKLVSMTTASTDRVDYLEKGIARLEAQIVSKPRLCRVVSRWQKVGSWEESCLKLMRSGKRGWPRRTSTLSANTSL